MENQNDTDNVIEKPQEPFEISKCIMTRLLILESVSNKQRENCPGT